MQNGVRGGREGEEKIQCRSALRWRADDGAAKQAGWRVVGLHDQSFDQGHSQFKLLSQAYNQGHSQFKPRWEDEDGSPQQTLIMKDLHANRRFYKGTDCF